MKDEEEEESRKW